MQKNEITIEEARAKLRQWIPQILREIFEHYRGYLDIKRGACAKSYKEFHQGGISALSHLEKLLRLYKVVSNANGFTEDVAGEIAELKEKYENGQEI